MFQREQIAIAQTFDCRQYQQRRPEYLFLLRITHTAPWEQQGTT